MDRLTHEEALSVLEKLHADLEEPNQSAAASLREGFNEWLTLQRLGLFSKPGRSFKMPNCLENVNALVEERCAKVDSWRNSRQRHRWLTTALIRVRVACWEGATSQR